MERSVASRMRTNSTIVFACAATASGECGSRWNVRSIASAWASGNQHIAVAQMSSSVAVVSSSVPIPLGCAEALDELDEGVRLGADRTEDLTVALERLPLDQPHEGRVGGEHAEVRRDELLEELPARTCSGPGRARSPPRGSPARGSGCGRGPRRTAVASSRRSSPACRATGRPHDRSPRGSCPGSRARRTAVRPRREPRHVSAPLIVEPARSQPSCGCAPVFALPQIGSPEPPRSLIIDERTPL